MADQDDITSPTTTDHINTTSGTIDGPTAARLLLLDVRRVQQLAAEGYIERAVRGRYRTVSVVQGYIRFLREDKRTQAASTADSRLREARSREIELRNARADHELIEYTEAEAVFDESMGLLKTEFDGFGAAMTRDLPMRRKIEAGIDGIFTRAAARVREALQALRATGQALDADAEDDA